SDSDSSCVGDFAHFQGLIDEVAIFNRVLSASEIQAIFHAGTAGMCKALTITTTALPGSALGEFASHQIETRFGTPPFTFSLVSGGLPPGMSLSPSGVVSGTPTTAGTFTITVQVTDATGAIATQTITQEVIVCMPPPSGLVAW